MQKKEIKELDLELELDLDEVETSIREYILHNPKKPIFQVAKAMVDNGICARATAEKKINGLKERGIIQDVKVKTNNFSCLVINNQNSFFMIRKD